MGIERSTGNVYTPIGAKSDIGSALQLGGIPYITVTSRSFEGLTSESIVSLIYSGSNKLYIDHITISTDSGYGSVEVYANPDIDSASMAGSSGSVTASNVAIDFGRANAPAVTASTGAGRAITASVDINNKVTHIRLSSGLPTYKLVFDGALILSNNESLIVNGTVSSSGDNMWATCVFTEFEAGL